MDTAKAIEVLQIICDKIQQQKDYLCELDAALGDGDHGISMAKSFHAVSVTLSGMQGQSLDVILNTVGMTLISEVGGAMGPLFGTAFMRAGKAVSGKETLTTYDLVLMLNAAEEGIVKRGHAQPGDKTLLDALHPAVIAAQHAAETDCSFLEGLQMAADAAMQGAESTREMLAKIGRSSRLGERSIGHQDPGATSLAIIMKTAAQAAVT
jgi:phosphoenolpyruvate---glycerone phosphotransferase subunit DhaL